MAFLPCRLGATGLLLDPLPHPAPVPRPIGAAALPSGSTIAGARAASRSRTASNDPFRLIPTPSASYTLACLHALLSLFNAAQPHPPPCRSSPTPSTTSSTPPPANNRHDTTDA